MPTSRMGTSLYPFTREKEKKKVIALVIIHFLVFLLAFVVKPVDRQGTFSYLVVPALHSIRPIGG